MAKNSGDIPAVPLPPQGSGVPPVEPSPAVASPPAASAYAAPPAPTAPVGPPTPLPPSPYQSAPAAPPAYAPAYAPAPAGPPQGLSLTSMITGIGGLLLAFAGLGFLPSLAAVITGHMAQKRQPYARPFWLTGIITGYIGLGLAVIGLLIILLIIAASASGSFR